MEFLTTLSELLEHIMIVEQETISLTKESQLKMVHFMEENSIVPDDETLEAMQYQDIVSQQLQATIDAILTAKEQLNGYIELNKRIDKSAVESIGTIEMNLKSAIEQAREKREAFGGRLSHGVTDIEFF